MKRALVLLALTGAAFAAGQRRSSMAVGAVVRPAARLEVQSASTVTVRVTMYPNTQVVLWLAANTCGVPENGRTIANPGAYQLNFTPEETQGKNIVCLVSSDGVLRSSARLP